MQKYIPQVIAVLLALITTVLLFLSIGLSSFRATLLNQAVITKILNDYGVYQQIPKFAVWQQKRSILRSDNAWIKETYAQHFNHEKWVDVFTQVLSPEWIQSQVELNISEISRWLSGETNYPHVQWDFTHIHNLTQRNDIDRISSVVFAHLPPCEKDDDAGGNAKKLCCRPSGEYAKELIENELPQKCSVQKIIETEKPLRIYQQQFLNLCRFAYKLFIVMSWGIWLICELPIVILLLLVAREPGQKWFWVGVPIALAGGGALFLFGLFRVGWQLLIKCALASFPHGGIMESTILFFENFLCGSVRDVTTPGLEIAAVVFMVGVMTLIVAVIDWKRTNH